uniref:Glycosyl-hydrolase family 116 N-terminal domain-containing protein n=1 Tax=Salix viminalis TaxID=40686 RepID=A0A6N2JWD9_SALVM
MVSSNLFHCTKRSWPPEEYISKNTLQLFDFDSAAPPEQAWRRRLNSHANLLKEFSVTFREAIQMVRLGIRLWSYVREEASHGRKAPIDPFTRESCKPSASQGVPLGGMGSGSISRGFRGEFRQWQIVPGICESSPVMANQFSIFISRDGGNKNYASVLAPGQHEGIGDSSLPTAVFVYTLVNTGKERAKVNLLFTWANSIGGISHLSGDHVNEPFIGEDGVSGDCKGQPSCYICNCCM